MLGADTSVPAPSLLYSRIHESRIQEWRKRREVPVVALSARAKSPPSAITLLETYAHLRLKDELPALFRQWEDDG